MSFTDSDFFNDKSAFSVSIEICIKDISAAASNIRNLVLNTNMLDVKRRSLLSLAVLIDMIGVQINYICKDDIFKHE